MMMTLGELMESAIEERIAKGEAIRSESAPWRYIESINVLRHTNRDLPASYEVDLDRCKSAAASLDWIVQVSKKTWVSDELLGQLVRSMNFVLDLQRTQCGLAMNQK